MASSRGKITVYWDGECPFCAAVAQKVFRFDTERRIHLVDYRDPAVAETALPRFSPNDLDREMHAHLPDGTWRIGFFAWAAVMKAMPKSRWLGRIMEAPIFGDIGPKAYMWFANRRLQISKLLGLPEPCGLEGSSCPIPEKSN